MIDLLYSDVHLREDKLHVFEKVHDEILEIADREGVIESGGFIINGGDTFHVRGVIRTSCFDLLYRKRTEWKRSGVERHIDIVGNHDQEDKDGRIHPMSVFREFGPEWYVVDEPSIIESSGLSIYAFPYISNLQGHLEKISTSKRKNAIALVHTGVHGAFKNDNEVDDFSIHPEVFRGFRATFSGHYHNRQMYENLIQYIGSPIQHTFSEMNQEKGVLLYDREENETRFVPIDGPKHFEVKVSWDSEGLRQIEKPSGITDQDIVRVRVHGTSPQVSSITRDDFDFGAVCKIERKTKDAASSRIKADDASKDDLLKMYVDYIDPDLDTEKLYKLGSKLLGEDDALV